MKLPDIPLRLRLLFASTLITLASAFSSLVASASPPPVVHSAIGDSSGGFTDGKLRLVNIGKLQQYAPGTKSSFDTDIMSPKSVTFSVDGSRFYVNSLEGCRTAVYNALTMEKLGVINYRFPAGTGPLWTPPSGFYPFIHYPDGASRSFSGKPVESTWSHGGRYLWVPFYRRTFDLNAQDPSAIAVIDSKKGEIVRMFETGPLPKMVATSPDSRLIAVTHWGDNTVGFIDISSPNIDEWHHLSPAVVGHKLNLNFSLTTPVNRDSNSGYLLRGTVFTPDGRYLLVSAMAGPLAVIDVESRSLVGQVSAVSSVRHLVIDRSMVYGSRNSAGQVIRFSLDSLLAGVHRAEKSGSRSITFGGGVRTCKVGSGARTLEVSPDGQYLYVACNSSNKVCVVNAKTMSLVDEIRCDSYPVGLAVAPNGSHIIVTSQGRSGSGGNAVNLFEIKGWQPIEPDHVATTPTDSTATDSIAANLASDLASPPSAPFPWKETALATGAAALILLLLIIIRRNRAKRKKSER